MSNPAMISEASATGEEIMAIIEEVEPILLKFPSDHAVIALLCIAATMMNPYASAEEIQDAVYATSQYMCLSLDGKGDMQVVGAPSKEVMN